MSHHFVFPLSNITHCSPFTTIGGGFVDSQIPHSFIMNKSGRLQNEIRATRRKYLSEEVICEKNDKILRKKERNLRSEKKYVTQ